MIFKLLSAACFYATLAIALLRYRPTNGLINWLVDSQRWHDLGHFLGQFNLVIALGLTFPFLPLWAIAAPSVVTVLTFELIRCKHYKDLTTSLDFWFDVFTHFAGIASAILLLIGR